MKRLEDLLIDGLKIYQDSDLYCFTSDAVLLSRFARAKKSEVAADFCSGSGIVGLHFYALNKRVIKSVTLFEMQNELHSLAEESIAYNGLSEAITAVNTRVQDISKEYTEKFSLVLCNPPYFKDERTDGEYDKIKACRNEITVDFGEIAAAAARTLRFGGRFCFAHIPERLPEIFLTLAKNKLEPKRLTLALGGGKIYLALIEAVKGGKPGLKIETTEN